MNCPLDCFGGHHKYNSDYCKVVRSLKKENTNSSSASWSITSFPNIPNKSTYEANSSFSGTGSTDSNVFDNLSVSLVDFSGSMQL